MEVVYMEEVVMVLQVLTTMQLSMVVVKDMGELVMVIVLAVIKDMVMVMPLVVSMAVLRGMEAVQMVVLLLLEGFIPTGNRKIFQQDNGMIHGNLI
jgi:hypothetical protein